MTGRAAQRFDKELRTDQQRFVLRATEAFRAIGQQAFRDFSTDARIAFSYGAPVASGRLAGSMRISLNEPDLSAEPADRNYRYPKGRGPRPLPPRTIPNVPASRASSVLRQFKLGDKIFISNSVPYIRKIEVGGHSWQTPGGVFGPTIRKLTRQFKRVLEGRGV